MPHIDRIDKIDNYVKKLSKTEDKWMSLAISVDIADEIMKGIIPDKNGWHEQLNHNSQEEAILPDPLPIDIFKTQKQETWFVAHPILGSARVALTHFNDEKNPLESRLYWFSEKETKQKVSVTTQFISNWEDSNLTRNENYKVAIDFFLSHDTNTLMMVLTDRQKLRVMEFNGSLSNTQKQILADKLFTIPYVEEDAVLSPQENIHTSLWDAFLLKEVNDKFYQGVSSLYETLIHHLQIENDITAADSKQFSSRLLGRLLFIWFLREMDLINEKMNYFETKGMTAGNYYKSYLKPLFFRTLNTPIAERTFMIQDEETPYLNGGLFDIKDNDFYKDDISFPEKYFEKLYDHFNEFNFTVDESSVDYELVAVDPEMLGQIFESLLASLNEDDDTSDRKKTGSFYTPRHIVDYMSKESIRQYLYREIDNEKYNKGIDDLIDMTDAKFIERKSSSTIDIWGTNTKTIISGIKKALDNVKIIDPAVGSGAYPMGMLQIMSKLYERITPATKFNSYHVKLDIIENNIYGVDIQPMAIEIARLRAWLAIIVDDYQDNQKVNPLPNLEFKFISANSLVELETQGEIWSDPELKANLSEIRDKYFNARATHKKEEWKNKYYRITRQTELFEDKRTQQLKSFDPFSNESTASFFNSQIMFGISKGFDIVIGNPPYIHFQKMTKEEREFHKSLNYETYAAQGDIYALFYELGINLLSNRGILTYITSNKWMRTGYGKKLRNYFIKNTNPLILIDLGEGVFDHASVDTNILIIKNEPSISDIIALTLEKEDIETSIIHDSVNINFDLDESWTILNPIEQSIKEKIEGVGTPLGKWNIQIRRGILTGLNAAFIITEEEKNKLIKEDSKSAELIQPILRGRDISRYSINFSKKYIINTHNGYIDYEGNAIKRIDIKDYPAVKKHLDNFEPSLSNRYDQGDTPYNIRNTAYMDDFNKEKIVWSDISTAPSFCLVDKKYYINNTAYMMVQMPPELIGILNSELIGWYFKKIAAGLGKSTRYTAQYINKIHVPSYKENIKLYTKIKECVELKKYKEIENILYDFYNLTEEEISKLKMEM